MTRALAAFLLVFPVLVSAQTLAPAALGPERALPAPSRGDAALPSTLGSIVPDRNGGYLVFWSRRTYGSSSTPIVVTRTDAAGAPADDAQQLVDGQENVWGLTAIRLPQDAGFLLVWNERKGLFTMLFDPNLRRVWDAPARLSAVATEPAAACNEVQCLVAVARGTGIEGILVSPSGQLTGGIQLVTRPARRMALSAADGGFVAAWVGEYPNEGVYATTFDDRMEQTSEMLFERNDATIAAGPNGNGATVVWSSGNDVRAARIDLAGRTTAPRVIARFESRPAIAGMATSETQQLVLLHYTKRPGPFLVTGAVPPADVYGVRISRTLDPLDREPFPIEIADYANLDPVAASNGRDYLVGWNHTYSAMPDPHGRLAFVEAGGAVGDTRLLRSGPQPQLGAALASGGSAHLAVWVEPAESGVRLLASVVTRAGTATPPSLVANEAPGQISAASDGRDYAVAWDANIAILDGATGDVKRVVQLPGSLRSDIVWTGRSYAIATRVETTVYYTRIAPDGTIVENAPLFQADPSLARLALAADDDLVALAWTDAGGTWLNTFGDDRLNTSAVQRISPRQAEIAVAVNRGVAMLVTGDTAGVFATRVAADGRRLDEFPRVLDARSGSGAIAVSPYREGFLARWMNAGIHHASRFTDAAHPPFRLDRAFAFAPAADATLSVLLHEGGRLVIRELVEDGKLTRRRATAR